MLDAIQGKEVVVRMKNDISILADLAKVVSEKGINLLAIQASTDGDNGIIRLITDDNLRAVDALRKHNYAPTEQAVVMVKLPHKPGMLRHVTTRLAEKGIDLHHAYASAGLNESNCLLVLHSANDDQTLLILNELRLG